MILESFAALKKTIYYNAHTNSRHTALDTVDFASSSVDDPAGYASGLAMMGVSLLILI